MLTKSLPLEEGLRRKSKPDLRMMARHGDLRVYVTLGCSTCTLTLEPNKAVIKGRDVTVRTVKVECRFGE